ncbi:fasciclin-like arabinogalactan protein 2 [Zingiber officinale]|uniref:FAS1 domain-containing protein n=1 Tax=Zingiber officinale TaxID=94328 RepID=A0A8J5CGP7_ZINOF|nr:fasciclin-like arabinogalactan protein 2 [Zingiber officinale]KAG6474459.1 hypothetical protein ZIOFF_068394 [Zingiber officinale]
MRRFSSVLAASLVVLAAAASLLPAARAHNITKILAQHPEFSTFNHYLSATHLASEINRRLTITLLVVDNSGMTDLLAKHLSLPTLRNVLALHVLTDYYGAKKLHQITGGATTSATIFQSSGHAIGTAGFINITDHSRGKVTFVARDSGGASPATFVKSVKEMPYNISILQISTILSSPEAEAPVAAPGPVNLTALMANKGCKAFADLLLATPDVLKSFQSNLDSGLTVFCPDDDAVSAFSPKYTNLTAAGKSSLLRYHAVPVYYSPQLLKTNNGPFSTLASDAHNKNYKYTVKSDGDVITIKTHIVTADITSTLIDQDPDAVYAIDKVLEPRELFKVPEKVIADAPAPAPAAPPKKKKSAAAKHKAAATAANGAPAPTTPAGPEESPADDDTAAADNAALRTTAAAWTVLAAAAAALFLA